MIQERQRADATSPHASPPQQPRLENVGAFPRGFAGDCDLSTRADELTLSAAKLRPAAQRRFKRS